jgi:dethiobiotin synthetase
MRGLFVTATDTGVGKTVLSAALLATIARSGGRVRAHKPAVTGLDEPPEAFDGTPWPPDHELLGDAAAMDGEDVAPLRYGPAVSPQLASELAGDPLAREQVLDRACAALALAARDGEDEGEDDGERRTGGATIIVEGVGGLLAPLADELTVCDLAVALGLPLLIAARPGLGTINHTLLTLQAARAAGLAVRAVVLTPWPREPSDLELSNRRTIERVGRVEVAGLARAAGPDIDELARVGASLPWRRWLGAGDAVAASA